MEVSYTNLQFMAIIKSRKYKYFLIAINDITCNNVSMPKKTEKRPRGRPVVDDSMDERVLVRMNSDTKVALDSFVKRGGYGGAATAIRIIVVERLRSEALLK